MTRASLSVLSLWQTLHSKPKTNAKLPKPWKKFPAVLVFGRNSFMKRRKEILLALMIFLLCSVVKGQKPSSPETIVSNDDIICPINTEIISIYFEVWSNKGFSIQDLTSEELEVFFGKKG